MSEEANERNWRSHDAAHGFSMSADSFLDIFPGISLI